MPPVIQAHTVPWRRLAIASLAIVTMMAFGVPRAGAIGEGFTITETDTTTATDESGTTDTFSIVLDTQPLTDVVLNVTSGDAGEGTVDLATLTFTNATWNVAQTVTVTGIDDTTVDGTQNYDITIAVDAAVSDDTYDAVVSQAVAVANADDEVAGFTATQSEGSTTTNESGTTDTFSIVLDDRPLTDVVLNVTSGDAGEGTVDLATLTFTNATWNVAQTVTVTGIDDTTVDGTQNYDITIAIDIATSDNAFDALGDQTVAVANTDDDVAGFTVTETDGSTSTHESGTTDTFDVVLTKGAVNDVVLTVTSSDTTEGIVDKATLTFTNANWNTPQAVTVTGIDDSLDDGSQPYTITVAVDAPGSDDAFDSLAAQAITAFNGDNDVTPVDPAFADLEGLSDEAVAAIETLVDLGITTGTDDTSFSPEVVTERWQMALFLTRVLEAAGATLPAAETGFSDLAGYSAEAQTAMNQLASLGISMGTSPDEFSPAGQVTRSQMALFLVRTLQAGGVALPTVGQGAFTDLAGYPAEVQDAVGALMSLGITTGTTETTFSPEAELPRWQMALFLARVIDVIQAG